MLVGASSPSVPHSASPCSTARCGGCCAPACSWAPATSARWSDSRPWWPTGPRRTRYDTAFGHYTFAASAGQALGPGLIVLFGGAAAIPDTHTIFTWTVVISGVLLLISFALASHHSRPRPPSAVSTGSIRDPPEASWPDPCPDGQLRRARRRRHQPRLPARSWERSGTSPPASSAPSWPSAPSPPWPRGSSSDGSPPSSAAGRLLTASIATAAVGMALVAVPMPVWLLVPGRGGARTRPRRRPATHDVVARRSHPTRPPRARDVAAADRQPPRPGRRPVRSPASWPSALEPPESCG